jgi:hypothetical protein
MDTADLEARRLAVHNEIEGLIAADLGYGDRGTLDDAQKTKVEERAELVINHWEETVEMGMSPREPSTRLEALLREHHEICEQIVDLRDQELGRQP